jgi:hypothetical protein
MSEGIALVEDVADVSSFRFLDPAVAYYRPLYHLSLYAAWHAAPSLDAFVATIRLFQIVPAVALVTMLIVHLRPKRPVDAAAATLAVAVLFGSPGFKDNLEIPLTYTIVGMAAALAVWMLLERDHRAWHGAAIVVLTVIAIGFKEQGLVLVPVVVVAWWMGAPGVRRSTALIVVGLGVAYVALRLLRSHDLPVFGQDIGLGFSQLSAAEATRRFGPFPVAIYAYNSVSTMANVLLAEPTAGVFIITRAMVSGDMRPWHGVYLASSIATTALIAWWAIAEFRRSSIGGWTQEARVAGVFIAALAASGALSFDYSRDRLGGMAVVFYALAGFHATRAFVNRPKEQRLITAAGTAVFLLFLAAAWQVRTLHTLEHSRRLAANSHREWLTDLHERRVEFAERPVFIHLLEAFVPQGTTTGLAQPTRFPQWLFDVLGPL